MIDWGDVPTAAAALLAAAAAWLGARALIHDRRKDRAREAEALRAQAERVSVYWKSPGPGRAERLVVANLSDQPITDTQVYAVINGEEVETVTSPDLVPPQDTAQVTIVYDNEDPPAGVEYLTTGWRFGVRFTDASGWRRWDRRPDGRLVWTNDPDREP